ncbi:hypothetical protein HPB47_000268 [Ixodes persulcatus]|uniref:Uncharacterized protein n=1 Tax=Ixodes persulcatus TaxID=34615 RepID=A0AC60PS67_IXOPE|nr:hypothetical protein HPB47_000268 [Ixodes persulcatus]
MYLSKPCKQSQQRLGTFPPRTSHGIRDVPDVARQTTDNHHRKIQHLLLNPVDVLAIQEPLTQPGDFRLSPYMIYSSAPLLANGRSRALLLVKAGLLRNRVDLSAFSSHSAEYVAATIRVHGVEFTVVSVRLGRKKLERQPVNDPADFYFAELQRTQYHMRGSVLEDVTTSLGLEGLNDGSETFVRQGVHGSVLYLTFTPRDIAASWTVIYLNLCAARWRAQRKARRTNIAGDWQPHRKIDAKFRRHTTRMEPAMRLFWIPRKPH